MNADVIQIIKLVAGVLPYVAVVVALGVGGSLLSTWLKIKNGYPLSNSWGMPLHPKADRESVERIKLLTNENAQLRAELGAVKDRLETIERIVTDQPSRLARDIDALTIDKGGNA
ncbi:MAG: hypothetical protein ABI454_08375 [Sphingomicrobium sp.]